MSSTSTILTIPAVLPPVSTTGLTAADVGALSVRVREMMVEALREISVAVPSSDKKGPISTSSPPTEAPASRSQDPLAHVLPSVTEAGPDVSVSTDSRSESRASQATSFSEDFSSPPSSGHGYEGSETGAETEEDEGMVLVGRPGH